MINIFDLLCTCLFFLMITNLLYSIYSSYYKEKYEIIYYHEKYYNTQMFNDSFDNSILENNLDKFGKPVINYNIFINIIYFLLSFVYFFIPE